MITLPFVEYSSHLSMDIKSEMVRVIHDIQRIKFVMNLWCRYKDTLA
jgi:hypothetical protein